MTTPTPTKADKQAAEEIVSECVDFLDDAGRDNHRREVAQIIATAMQPEREALRLAKAAVGNAIPRMNELTRSYKHIHGNGGTIDFDEAVAQLKSALAAIEKVEG